MITKVRTSGPWVPALYFATAAFAPTGCGSDGGENEGGPVEDDPPPNPLYRPAELAETAPGTFQARFETSKGAFVVEVTRAWAPAGADRFYTLVKNGYYDGVRFYRVLDGFVAQFGLHGDPLVTRAWRDSPILDDSVVASNTRGMVTYAMGGPHTRTTQIFVNYGDNSRLDARGFAPFGRVTEGMDVVDQFYSGYGEGAPSGTGPSQRSITAAGNAYLEENFPELDSVISATLIESEAR